ncbi:MAG: hypothetical protein KKD48_00010 [Nanoarchaeota archaeon]|nr:hypothetical protein [Nanoarchaeota archaeon]
MKKYTVYFSRDMYGYKTFKAENDEKAEEIVEDLEINGNFPDDFDHVKDEGWIFVDWDREGVI